MTDAVRKTASTALCLLLALMFGASDSPGAEASAWTRVSINGQLVPVSFNDGDSFRVQAGQYSGSQCRLAGFNTLESFGPAHQWGIWHPYELYINAKQATRNGRRGTWHCTTDGSRDGYGRLLMDCPDLAISHISQGFGHAYQVDDTPSRPEYIRAQRDAIANRRGMWAHGVPDYIMTSIHSASEDPSREWHYNRLISTHDGHSESYRHHETYGECDWVCSTEIHADEAAVTAEAQRLRGSLGPLFADRQNYELLEIVRRYARLGTMPDETYVSGPARAAIETALSAARESGRLGTTTNERGSCMLNVDFTRRYGSDRASCLRDHGSVPPGVSTAGHR